MAVELTTETEYVKLWSTLDPQRVLSAAQRRSIAVFGNTSLTAHLAATGELAGTYADKAFPDCTFAERRYRKAVCVSAGYGHHMLAHGYSLEQIIELADEAVAKIIAAMTPDLRIPEPQRTELLGNRIGSANLDAQIVMAADIRHTSLMMLEKEKVSHDDALWAHRMKSVSSALHSVRSSEVSKLLSMTSKGLEEVISRGDSDNVKEKDEDGRT